MRFEWDAEKDRQNQRKHHISFDTAALVFEDPLAISRLDRIIDGEERWHTLGLVASGGHMKKLTQRQAREVAALSKMRDSAIDLSDIPEVLDWRGAVVGRFYRPVKKSVTLRLDADVLAWLKSNGEGYQTRINRLLRAAMDMNRSAS